MRVDLTMHGLSFNDTHFVWSETLATRAKKLLKLNKQNKHFFNKTEHYIILFLISKYLLIFNMSNLSIKLKSTEKSYTFPFKDISLDSKIELKS